MFGLICKNEFFCKVVEFGCCKNESFSWLMKFVIGEDSLDKLRLELVSTSISSIAIGSGQRSIAFFLFSTVAPVRSGLLTLVIGFY